VFLQLYWCPARVLSLLYVPRQAQVLQGFIISQHLKQHNRCVADAAQASGSAKPGSASLAPQAWQCQLKETPSFEHQQAALRIS
jgi:hypothetical protein